MSMDQCSRALKINRFIDCSQTKNVRMKLFHGENRQMLKTEDFIAEINDEKVRSETSSASTLFFPHDRTGANLLQLSRSHHLFSFSFPKANQLSPSLITFSSILSTAILAFF